MMALSETGSYTLILELGLKGHILDGVHLFKFDGRVASCRVEASMGTSGKLTLLSYSTTKEI